MRSILFLCTGNSCRSQMAEGWLRQLRPNWRVMSAGIEAHGKNPKAIQVMAEVGIDISGQASTQLTEDMLTAADVLVTVCGHADEHCPMPPAGCQRRHWPLEDPARATGSEQQIMTKFREIRDQVAHRVRALVAELEAGHEN